MTNNSPPVVTLSVSSESRHLYEEALRLMPAEVRHKFSLEERPPSPEAAWEREARAAMKERDAVDRGRRTLGAIRTYLRETGQDDPQRRYWRDAQRRHRAVPRG